MLLNCYRPGVCIHDRGVAVRNYGGQQIAQNTNLYTIQIFSDLYFFFFLNCPFKCADFLFYLQCQHEYLYVFDFWLDDTRNFNKSSINSIDPRMTKRFRCFNR